jgi:hypothetical protein
MSSRPEIILLSSLTDIERLEYLAREGIDTEIVPTAVFRPLVDWAVGYLFDSGCKQAPSREALELEWGNVLDAEEVELIDPEEEMDTIEWVLEYLRSTYLHLQWQQWSKDAAAEMAGAVTGDRIEIFVSHSTELGALLSRVRSRKNEMNGRQLFEDALRRYEERRERAGAVEGLMLGLTLADQHTNGIHPGELAVVGPGPRRARAGSWATPPCASGSGAAGRRCSPWRTPSR